jgi:DNA-binding response OmpR family regulator
MSSLSPSELVNPLLLTGELPVSIFGDGRVRVNHNEENLVYVDDEARALKPISFQVLSVLAANGGYYVPHDFTLNAVWPDFDPNGYAHSGISPSTKISNTLHHVNKVLGIEDLGHPETGTIRTLRGIGATALLTRGDLHFVLNQ